MNLSQNQNNFPSKVLEYLASGRRVISTKFPGWERFVGCFKFYDGSMEELAVAMSNCCDASESEISELYNNNREKAMEFDWNNQVIKMLDILG